MTPDSPVSEIPGLKKAALPKLERLGITTVADLLYALPYDWVEPEGQVIGTVVKVMGRPSQKFKSLMIFTAVIEDDRGGERTAVFFRRGGKGWRATSPVKAGERVALGGQVNGRELKNPVVEKLTEEATPSYVGALMPKYHLTRGVKPEDYFAWVSSALPVASALPDPLPPSVRERKALMSVAEAIKLGHQPKLVDDWRRARQSLAFIELFELQVAFAQRRNELASESAPVIAYRQDVIDRFKEGLGFELTNAQRKATWDVFKDMEKPLPMNRLLNGDVGSGKTAVAAAAAAMAHAAGKQTVLMAPTEILARQHLGKLRAYLEGSFPDLSVELLVSGLSAPERRRVRMSAASGHCAVVVGTHALLEDEVELLNLGLAVVDEQHRFGTRQRELLRRKAKEGVPHFLAMTATPIPRTLALAMYGEMSVSVLDEMPPGRTPVETMVLAPDERETAYELVRKEVAAGRQAFVICPLIEESEKLQAKAATAEAERLQKEVFPKLNVDLVHGRLSEKDEVMERFRKKEIDILVATSVVEVGVDVPNATVMLIEGADRFGLAQLHQFRGRVGRGSQKSWCILLADEPTETSLERLHVVENTTDGFKLAREDMRLRGMGELMGARQHGMTDAAMDALSQPGLIDDVREEAEAVIAADPELERHPVLRDHVNRRLELSSIS